MRRISTVLLCCWASLAVAQIDDRGYSATPSGNDVLDFSFEEEQSLTADAEIPAVGQRDEGPSIEVAEFRFRNIPAFPELGITRQAVERLAESLRQQYTRKDDELPSGYTEAELLAIAELLPATEPEQAYRIEELEQIADYILSISGSDAFGGLRQYELKGLVDLMVNQRLARGISDNAGIETINSLVLDDLIQLVKRQRTERGINFYELEDIAARISGFYRSKGVFLAKAYIPVQTVKDGIVHLDILAGVLSSISVQGNRKYATSRLTQPFDDYLGKAAKSDELEEALFLINDFPGLTMQGALSAGNNIGETTLNLSVVEEKAWRLTMTADNHGAVFTGDKRLLTMLDLLNPLGIGDSLTVGFLRSWDPVSSDVGLFQYRVPVFDERTYAYISADVNKFEVDGNGDASLDSLNLEGKNTNLTVGMERQFKRLPSLSYGAGFALTEKETEVEADLTLPDQGDKVQGVQLDFSFNNISKQYRLMNIATASLQYGKFKSGASDISNQDEEFYKLAINWSALKLIDLPFTDYQSYFLGRSKWRYSESELPAFEQLPLGGADAVRAYTVSDFSADQGVYLGLEWYVELPLDWVADSIADKLKTALFVDGAYGVRKDETVSIGGNVGDKWAHLAGAGVLFKFTWREMLSTTISFSKPVSSQSNADDFAGDSDSVQTYVELSFVYD